MNILPKKRWHVRTKENIARVRRDEANAAKEEKEKQIRVQKAETEARINFLRNQARQVYDGRDESSSSDATAASSSKLEHVNFFADLEEGRINANHGKTNKEHDKEVEEEKNKYEKQIGYLTYLGQDTNEATGKVNWYDEMPQRLTDVDSKNEVQEQKKKLQDPLNFIKKAMALSEDKSKTQAKSKAIALPEKINVKKEHDLDEYHKSKHNKKSKKSKKSKKESMKKSHKMDIEKLRQERLLREKAEKLRTEALLAKLRDPAPEVKKEEEPVINQRYNNQFFPELARQNQVRRKER